MTNFHFNLGCTQGRGGYGSSSYKEGEEEDYFNLEDSEGQLYNFGSSGKGDVHLRGTEEDVEILETYEGEEPFTEPVDEVALHMLLLPKLPRLKLPLSGMLLLELSRVKFSFTVSDFNCFAETPEVAPPTVDPWG